MIRRYRILFCILSVLFAAALVYGFLGTGAPAADGPKKFASADELDRYVREHTSQNSPANELLTGVRQAAGLPVAKQSTANLAVPAAVPVSAGQGSSVTSSGSVAEDSGSGQDYAQDYSHTNVQVAGVDEADFVKNDGKYIYLINNGQLVIVDAYPGTSAAIVSRTDLDGTPANLFLSGDRLLVISEDYSYGPYDSVRGAIPSYSGGPDTRIDIYSVADRSSPELIGGYSVDGSYFDSRMIGDYIYIVSKSPVILSDKPVPMPAIQNAEAKIMTPDVYYFDNPDRQFVFHTISSVNIDDPEKIEARTFLLGYSATLYVSPDNMYISYPKPLVAEPKPVWGTAGWINPAPSVPTSLPGPDLSSPDVMDRFNRMSEDQKQAFMQELQGSESWQSYETDRTATAIHKFSIDQGRIDYVAEGIVKGNLLNQFSMDEYKGNLRVATTSDVSTPRNSYQYNNVIVLDPGMKPAGSLTHIAMNEKIYSARFIGDRLYLVTFKRMDPFFVIDMADPGNIRILGKLKIPGYSDYLHPYDENHIIGIGKETGTNSWGGISTGGVKVALFDVSDVDHPKQVSSYEIGGPGSDSPALRDHRAFLFSKDKNILVLPVSVVSPYQGPVRQGTVMMPYHQETWQGAYVFGFKSDYGIVLKGTISHSGDLNSSSYYQPFSDVKRSLCIGDELTTISDRYVKINSLSDLNSTLATIDLGNRLFAPIAM